MAKVLPRKALIAISSYHDAIYPNGVTGKIISEYDNTPDSKGPIAP
jgi:hypothetical protein